MPDNHVSSNGGGSMNLIPAHTRWPGSRWASGRRARRKVPARAAAASSAVSLSLALAMTGTPAASAAQSAAAPGRLAGPAATNPACPWLNQRLSVNARVTLLMSRMTLANKITVVEGQGTSQPYVFYMAAQPSLCIPSMGLEDGPNGVGDGLTGVTQLPAGVSLAATFDPALARQYGAVIGAEERGKGAAVNLGPTVNIDRDPRWGRSFESFTEDPFLNAALTVGEIGGVQSQGEMSQVKHFAAYNQEINRNTLADNVIASARTLHEIYLPAFQQAVTRAKVASVMCAFSVINGDFACQNPYLENTTLKGRWAFPGFVTSDYAAIHATSAALDGTDMEQPFSTYFGQALETGVLNGTIPVSVLNDMVSRILTEMFRFNLFNDPPTGTPATPVTTPAHQAVSAKVAEAGTVLLKNAGAILPLRASHGGTIAVIGPSASASPTDGGGGSARVTAPFSVTPLQGLTAGAGPGTSVVYQQGLPTDTSLPAIPASALSPAYAPTPFGGTYTGTLTAPETGTYVLAITNPCGCYTATNLFLGGTEILSDPGTPPVSTYSVSVVLHAGQTYPVKLTGASSALTWARPSALAPGIDQAAAAARSAATAVVVVSDDTETEAADRPGLDLPSAQNELIAAVAAANPHTVVVIDAGAPVAMPWISHVAAVADAWYPGESNGTALASVLYGATDPSGHLPVTFPRDLSQVPASTPAQFPGVNGQVDYSEGIQVGYRWYDAKGITPLFPFGYGLSYTRFSFSHLRITPAAAARAASGPSSPLVRVSAVVTNSGKVTGSDVVQLYLGDPAAAGEPPRQLKAFDKVTLRPHQSSLVSFVLDRHDLSYFSEAANGWVLPAGTFQVHVGDSSALAGLPLRGTFTAPAATGRR
jgi:beta-glucosidase